MSLLPLPRPCASSRRRLLCSICSITARASPSRSFTSPSSSFTDKAVFVSPEHGAHIRRLSRPSESDISQKQNALEPDEVLIENVAVASNPKDWKSASLWTGLEGNDLTGRILAVGSSVQSSFPDLQPGQRVAAFTPMRTADKYGAYQAHTVCPAHTVAPLPDNVSFEQAATLPLAGLTAAVALFIKLKITPPSSTGEAKSVPEGERRPLLIWGASSSVGSYAVQLAKFAGQNHILGLAGSSADLARRLGADAVFDYRNGYDAVKEEILRYLQNRAKASSASVGQLELAFDAVSSDDTVDTAAQIIHSSSRASGEPKGRGVITTLLPTSQEKMQKEVAAPNASPIIKRTQVGTVHAGAKEFGTEWLRRMLIWAGEGKLELNRVKIMPGGLDGVPEGLHLLKEGKVSGEKLVYQISETSR